MTRGLVAVLASELVAFALLGVVVVDVKLHSRLEQAAGVNIQGYRGPIAPARAAGERRLLFVGGSTAFGYGVLWDEAFPAYLAYRLVIERNRVTAGHGVTAINAASIGDGAYAFPYAVRDFGPRVDPDVVVLDAGYDALCDGCEQNRRVGRHESKIFVATGYMPIVPVYLHEKAVLLQRSPAATRRFAGHLFEGGSRALRVLDAAPSPAATASVASTGCGRAWDAYCGAIRHAVADALRYAKGVVVVTPPYISARHREQQRAMADMLKREFGADRRVVYLDRGGAIDMNDRQLTFDGIHLTARGHHEFAESLVAPMNELLERW